MKLHTLRPTALRPIALLPFLVLLTQPAVAEDWPQASGPNFNFVVAGQAPDRFSVSRGQNVLWRTPLPNTGQGAVIVSGGRAFVTSHEPISKDTETGSMILGLCFDAQTGREIWRREIPAARVTDLSSLFSDNTAASPVADGKHVVFTNVGGAVSCFDFDGTRKWSHTWIPFGRHHARQHEPLLDRGEVILLRIPRNDLPLSATTKAGAQPLGRGAGVWTYLQAYEIETGHFSAEADEPTSVHATSLMGRLADGTICILTGRGGAHQPPEQPYGLSLIIRFGLLRIWNYELENYPAAQNCCWNQDVACLFVGREHRTLDIKRGEPLATVSLVDDVTVCRFEDGKYVTKQNQRMPNLRKAITNQSNCLVGDYHYFRAHDDFLIGRVNIRTNRVEYLQVPVQVVRQPGQPDEVLWQTALPNDMKNADGYLATQDKRNAGNGWGHVSAASPTVIGDKIYLPTMIGMVYVLKWDAETLDEKALVSISDLGPATQTWSLASLSYADGKIYARTLKELICIGAN